MTKVLLAVSGSVAAYKAVELARLLVKAGCSVRTVMTEHAQQFVHPNSFAAVTGQSVYSELFDKDQPMVHIQLAKWADKVVIAPASASLIGRLANGLCSDLLTSICLASRAKMFIAPAMNQYMWEHSLLQNNVETLKQAAYYFLGPVEGIQACGDQGFGRMMEPDAICQAVTVTPSFAGRTVLITAGPTREAIDPIRFLSNHSSGKMGYALAEAFREKGASVILISGPTTLAVPKLAEFVPVQSAEEMLEEVLKRVDRSQVFISSAAVSDYRVKELSERKIKKSSEELTLTLKRNPDILTIVSKRQAHPFLVGFAAETDNLAINAKAKLRDKNLDMIVANRIGSDFSPFHSEFNEVLVIKRNGEESSLPLQKKCEIADKIADIIASSLNS
ncbi:MAG: bifunctional phosphopantothenoylcysteine decarboxylase/phosphopantothenate--cysteine ligase CoaBC [Deltaproteobacteria bacterium]|nr:bifunctional phosphopantothenoylcysteine decarboxylase/phosphopantothenate--cysteine ligase CoaBC [Deltaproteobacteria bacterium]